jgi:hypothetical protein
LHIQQQPFWQRDNERKEEWGRRQAMREKTRLRSKKEKQQEEEEERSMGVAVV